MATDAFKKLRAWSVVALLTLFMPTILLISVLIYLYDNFVRSKVCKDITGEVAVVNILLKVIYIQYLSTYD